MATFQTSTLVDGAWVARDVDPMTVLQHHQQLDNDKDVPDDIVEAPEYGILTRTIVQSPIFHWVLPIRLRGISENAVAFIGVRHPVLSCSNMPLRILSLHNTITMTTKRFGADIHRTLCAN